MSPAAVSIFAFGLYLAGGGILLVLAPDQLCDVLGLRPPGETLWVRLSGVFFLDLAFYCIRAARREQAEFIRWSVVTRPFMLPFLAAAVAFGLENPAVLVFGVIDVLAAAWTLLALRGRADAPPAPR
jgi:hypothetical protein